MSAVELLRCYKKYKFYNAIYGIDNEDMGFQMGFLI
jgi:hypothetical protein